MKSGRFSLRTISIVFLFFLSSALFANVPALHDENPSLRLQALHDLQKKPSDHPDILLALIERLKDPVAYVQSEAMFSLEKIGKPAIPYLLKYKNAKDTSQRWRVLHLLAKHKIKEIIPILEQDLINSQKNNDWTLHCASLYTLGIIGGAKEVSLILNTHLQSASRAAIAALFMIAKRDLRAFLKEVYGADEFYARWPDIVSQVIQNLNLTSETLLSLIHEKNPATQTGVLFILRHIPARGTLSFFSEGLHSSTPAVRAQASLGIQLLVDAEKLSLNEKKYLENEMMPWINDKNSERQNLAIKILTRLKSQKAWSDIIPKLNHEKIPMDIKRNIIAYIGNMKVKNAISLLLPFLAYSPLEEKVLDALFHLEYKDLTNLLIERLNNKKIPLPIQQKSIELLGRLSPPQGDQIILPFLSNPDLYFDALQTLTQMKSSYTEDLLISYSAHQNTTISLFSIRELGKLRSKKSVNFLIHHLSSRDLEIVESVIHSLKQIGDKQAAAPIALTLLTSQNPIIIKNALSALGDLKDPSSAQYMTPFLKHNDLSIRKSARVALAALQEASK